MYFKNIGDDLCVILSRAKNPVNIFHNSSHWILGSSPRMTVNRLPRLPRHSFTKASQGKALPRNGTYIIYVISNEGEKSIKNVLGILNYRSLSRLASSR